MKLCDSVGVLVLVALSRREAKSYPDALHTIEVIGKVENVRELLPAVKVGQISGLDEVSFHMSGTEAVMTALTLLVVAGLLTGVVNALITTPFNNTGWFVQVRLQSCAMFCAATDDVGSMCDLMRWMPWQCSGSPIAS